MIRSRWWGAAISVAVAIILTWPVVWEKGRDSFPLSSYPMFARREVRPTIHLHYAFGVDGRGDRRVIGPEHVANSEVLQARAALSRAVAGGRKKSDALCRSIAESISGDDDFRGVREVRIVSGRHDAVAYLKGQTDGKERLRAQCPVGEGR